MLARMSSLWRSDGVSLCLQRRDLEDRNIPLAGPDQLAGSGNDTGRFSSRRHLRSRDDAENGAVTRRDWVCADGRAISLITIADAGHQWPGAAARHPLIERLPQLDPPSAH